MTGEVPGVGSASAHVVRWGSAAVPLWELHTRFLSATCSTTARCCRELLVSGLRDAFQELSPGGKVLSGEAVRRTPTRVNVAQRSADALQRQASRVLFKVTAGGSIVHCGAVLQIKRR